MCLKLAENGTQTGNDVDQLVGNGGLTTSVVFHGQRANHVRGVLGRAVHRIAAVRAGVNRASILSSTNPYRALCSQAWPSTRAA